MKKILISCLCCCLMCSIVSCSASVKNENDNTVKAEDMSQKTDDLKKEEKISKDKIDADISKHYDGLVEDYNKNYSEKNIKINEEKVNKNKEILKQIHTLAKINTEKGVLVEEKNDISNKENVVKTYLKDGNFRKEEFSEQKPTGLTVYNKDKDTLYSYKVDVEGVINESKYSKERNGFYPYKFGYFLEPTEAGGILYNGDIEEVEYEGKDVYYLHSKLRVVDYEYWIDKETGFILKTVKTNNENPDKPLKMTSTFKYYQNINISENLFITDEENIKNELK